MRFFFTSTNLKIESNKLISEEKMHLTIVGGAGLHASEVKAVSKMESEFQNSWHAYAGLVVADKQGSMEIDCLIITHDRLLLVELKEWNGIITTEKGKWFQNGKNRGKSPYAIKREQAQRLKNILKQEVEHRIGYFLNVEAHVVLCGNATPENIPASERPFVHTMGEFLALRNNYEAIVQTGSIGQFFVNSGKPRPNSEKCLPVICEFFEGTKVKAKELMVGNFVAQRKAPWFQHRNYIYEEFKAQDRDRPSVTGLIRRWDFNKLGTQNALQSTWSDIALRESRIGRFVRDNTTVLGDYLLHSVNDLSQDDITEDTCELYELRRTYSRLDDVIISEAKNWNKETRIDRVRALITPFSDLHSLKIAHRDIDPHNLWFAEDQNTILTSGFGAAFFPEAGTVSDHRRLLQSTPISLPEDKMSEGGEILDPFKLDVFLLASVAYQLCFGEGPLPTEDDVPEWKRPKTDPFNGELDQWFEKALSWVPEERFDSAIDMLSAFNGITATNEEHHSDADAVFDRLIHSPYIRQDLNPFVMLNAFPPLPERASEAFAALASQSNKKTYLSEKEKVLLVKLWTNISITREQTGVNRRVLQFMQRIETIRNSKLLTPAVIDFGVMAQSGIFVATEYVDGETWSSYLAQRELQVEDKLTLASTLVKSVMDMHELQIAHGDLHVDNLLVSNNGERDKEILLLDLIDFGTESPVFNTHYGPSNPAVTDAFGRDRFATFLIVEELFGDTLPKIIESEIYHARDNEYGIPIALKPLLDAIEQSLLPEQEDEESNIPPEESQPLVVYWSTSAFPSEAKLLEPVEDGYYVNCRWNRNPGYSDHLQCYITGSNAFLQVNIDVEKRKIINIRFIEGIPLSDVVSASRRSTAVLTRPIAVQNGSLSEGHPLLDVLMNLEPVIDAIVDKYSGEDVVESLTEEERLSIKPMDLWKALAQTEGDLRQAVTIESTDYKEALNGDPMLPYTCLDSSDLHIECDDTLLVYMQGKDEPFGEVNIQDTTSTFLAIKPNYSSALKQIRPGTILQIESIRNKSSRELRHRALERVLSGKAIIPNLMNYFDSNQKNLLHSMTDCPKIEEIRDLYDEPGRETNIKQLEAFQKLIEQGPVGVLQGPPGTGKTTFVSKFIHYLFVKCGVANILLVGQQHTAVDNVAIKAQELCLGQGLSLDTVRIGHEQLIDSRMLPSHTRSLQQKIRHKFHREYDLRIEALSKRLSLPLPLVRDAARLHRSLNLQLVILSQYKRERNQMIRIGGASQVGEAKLEALAAKENKVFNTIEKIIRSQFDSAIGELPHEPELILDKLLDILAASHGVNNPDHLQRLRDVLDLSQEWLDVLQSGEAGYERFMLKTKQLVCGTLVGVGRRSLELQDTQFDWVIIDEAGRAQASELMVAMQCAKRVLLVGDHKQLPPFYHKAHLRLASKKLEVNSEIFDESDFERAYKACDGVTLDTQYRMIEPIGDLVSACFYAEDIGKLHTGRSSSPEWYDNLPFPWSKGVSWIDSTTPNGEKSIGKGRYINPREIDLLNHLLRQLVECGAVKHLRDTVTNEQPYPIGIITMYRAQKEEIESSLSRAEWMGPLRELIKVDTVDSYQGQENKIIILSLVRDNNKALQGFLKDAPRINVAISRAQERLIVLGANRMWKKDNNDSALGKVFEYISEKAKKTPEQYHVLKGENILGEPAL
ncbi:NERD domain-containing protein [Xenorhabdus sp. Vera]|uniref:AAA domain-containing protein n=1 Tax=Xenorhabdus koppenhoeferi TaxID=351659 RepID=UPI0019B5577E|nr:AAA domain-containing protein [Xenorhabdus sp. Vera]MBD2812475.1 NERD domain-containing protein [Xenorhabdus sp. Vera]